MPDPILFTVDGKQVGAQPGQTILQAAMASGIYIPYLCYFPKMKPYGACRTCVVETEVTVQRGDQKVVQKATVASCTAPAQKDMIVHTNSDPIRDLRKGIIELLMAEHPHGCLTCHRIELCGPQDICQRHVGVTDRCTICPKNERCELKDTVRMVELDLRTPLNYHRRNLPIHTDDPFYDRDYNLCIVCARCVRVCEEVRFDTALTLTNRSGVSLVGTSHGTSLLESGCEFCGACVDVCPVGALVERDYKWEKASRKVKTICTNCPVGCQMVAEVNRYDKVVRSVADIQGDANNGQACFKGKFGYDYPNAKQRLKHPYVREGGVMRRVTWDDALGRAAAALKKYKPEELAVVASPRGTNEDNYVAGKFARVVLKTNNVDSGLNIAPELLDVLRRRLGYGAATNPVWHLERSKCVLVVAGNPTEEQNVLAVPVKKAARAKAAIIVVDTRETELTRYATEWLRVRPGTEALLLSGMARVIIDETLEDKEFVSGRTSDLEPLKHALARVEPSAVAGECGVDEAQLRRAARAFAKSGASAVLLGPDTAGGPAVRSAMADASVNLALLCGSIGKEGAGVFPLYSGANTAGSLDVGCAPALLPGPRPIESHADWAEIGSLWGAGAPTARGVGMPQLAGEIRAGRIKAAIVMGDGLDPDAEGLDGLGQALGRLEFLAVSAVFDSEATARAQVVLPAAPYSEQQGTVTNVERRVQLVRRISAPKNEEKSGWETFGALAGKLGPTGLSYKSAEDVFAEVRKAVPHYAGLSHERLADGGIQSPCLEAGSAGTPILHFQPKALVPPAAPTPQTPAQTGSALAQATVVVQPPAPAQVDGGKKLAFVSDGRLFERPLDVESGQTLLLAHGRVLHQSGREAGVVKRGDMNYISREEVASIHPDDAVRLGIRDGDLVDISGEAGGETVTARVKVGGPPRGVAQMTTLFGTVASAMQDDPRPDPSPYVKGLWPGRVRLTKRPVRVPAVAAAG